MKIIFRRWFDKCKRRIARRLDKSKDSMTFEPQFSASNIHYEVSDRVGAILSVLRYTEGVTSMKRMQWARLCAVVAVFAGGASARQDAAPTANPVSATLKSQLPRFAKNMVAAAEAMPAEKYSFKPTPEMNTYAHLVMHSAQANYGLCSKVSGTMKLKKSPSR